MVGARLSVAVFHSCQSRETCFGFRAGKKRSRLVASGRQSRLPPPTFTQSLMSVTGAVA